jgi:lysophospholipase L1-like esterase
MMRRILIAVALCLALRTNSAPAACAQVMFVAIGDSILALGNNMMYQISSDKHYRAWVNLGVGGQQSTQIAARIATATAYAPTYVLCNAGLNDFVFGFTYTQFITDWTVMLDAINAAGARPVVLVMTPATSQSNAYSTQKDAWNIGLIALAQTKNAIIVDPRAVLGQFRAGGDAGNLWDFLPALTIDGMHPNDAGYAVLASFIEPLLP